MTKRFLLGFITFVFCVPCFAEELPSVPELIKRMYDYRMAIENMRAEATATWLVDTRQPIRETITHHFSFFYDRGRVRVDRTWLNPNDPRMQLYQYLSTPDFYFFRHPHGVPAVNDGNSLFLDRPLTQRFDTLDPRRIGTDWASFDTIMITHFNYDTLLDKFYNAIGENYNVVVDYVDGEKLYKISYQVNHAGISNSYWINPQKGYNLVRAESESELLDRHSRYVVTLGRFSARNGEIWFPIEISYKLRHRDNILEERVAIESVAFDVQDESQFTLAGLGIPIGYRVEYFDNEARFWDGSELVERIPEPEFVFERANRGIFWTVRLSPRNFVSVICCNMGRHRTEGIFSGQRISYWCEVIKIGCRRDFR